MSAWDDVIAAALLGTARYPFTPPSADGRLGSLLGGLDINEQPGALLAAAVVLRLYQRAGHAPRVATSPPPLPCDPDDLPSCTERAGHDLAMMVAGEHEEALGEWLAALGALGRRVPPQYLPDLLAMTKKQAALRDAVMLVLGSRGRWLAAQNPEWREFVEADEESWETAGAAQRLNLLNRLRESDPNHARELVASTWAVEPGETRARMLATFGAGLRMADEPFLETCLDDRHKDVRRTAATMLARLPDSRLCLRMIERVRTLVTLRREGVKKIIGRLMVRNDVLKIDVALPDTCTDAMVRDGVVRDRLAGGKIGERAWWLRQMLSIVPPSFWCTAAAATPAEFLDALEEDGHEGEWNSVLLEGIAQATCRHHDAAWAEALLASPSSLQGSDGPVGGNATDTSVLDGLLSALPAAQWEAAILRLYASISDPVSETWVARFFDHLRKRPWTVEVSRAFLVFVDRYKAAGAQKKPPAYNRWWLLTAIKRSAGCIPPSMVSDAATALPPDHEDPSWTESRQHCLTLLQFRHDMLEEIAR